MNIKHTTLLASALAFTPAFAVTTFTQVVDTDFNNASNWDTGLPDVDKADGGGDDDAVIAIGNTAITSASYGSGATAGEHFNLTVQGVMTVSTGHAVHLGNGNGHDAGADLRVDGGTLNIDGIMTVIGSGADTFVTNGGIINVRSGGELDERKSMHLTDGTLSFASDAASTVNNIDHLNVGSGSTIHFDIFSTTFSQLSLDQDLDLSAGGAILDLTITGATAGDSYSVAVSEQATGIDGTFGAFNYTINGGLIATLDYSAADTVTVNITVPEPSSVTLLGLGGLALILRRRK